MVERKSPEGQVAQIMLTKWIGFLSQKIGSLCHKVKNKKEEGKIEAIITTYIRDFVLHDNWSSQN